jgi:hypothetical protein
MVLVVHVGEASRARGATAACAGTSTPAALAAAVALALPGRAAVSPVASAGSKYPQVERRDAKTDAFTPMAVDGDATSALAWSKVVAPKPAAVVPSPARGHGTVMVTVVVADAVLAPQAAGSDTGSR